MSASVPERIGPYRIQRRLGAGGMADVFLGVAYGASGFEKQVAIKTLREEHLGDTSMERLLLEEAKLGARLVHECLVGVHELGVDAGRYYVRMDYVDGDDLASLMASSPIEVPLTLLIAERVALALAYVHRAPDERGNPLGLVHRDVSPQNVLISRHGEVKLGDFGIAKATQRADTTQANLRRGKYAYMSPEQVARAALRSSSDQFGLGVMLFEMLTGARPFDGDSPLITLDRIREALPPDTSAMPEDVADIVLRCLARDPNERFRESEALVRALAECRRLRPSATALDLARWVSDKLSERGSLTPPPTTRPGTRPITTG